MFILEVLEVKTLGSYSPPPFEQTMWLSKYVQEINLNSKAMFEDVRTSTQERNGPAFPPLFSSYKRWLKKSKGS